MFVCHRFPDQETFLTLAAAEGLVQDGQLITGGHEWAIDPVGVITEGGTYNAQGEVISPSTVIPGFHVNALGIAPEAWDEFLVVVNSPARVFLGGPTQAPTSDILEELMP
jgi:hypothetical protein